MKNKILLTLICCITLLSGCGKTTGTPENDGDAPDVISKIKTETNLQHVTRSGGASSVCSSKIGTYYQSLINGAIGIL